ncbi:MAG: lycopene cyclase domain-containing protein [Bacteroidales bacterium]
MSLYASLLLLSIAIPFLLSFEKRMQYYRQWKYLMPAIVITAIFYIVFDVYLTKAGVWGFNPRYHSNILIFHLPLEEWLFFILIPYASIFLHDTIVLYLPKLCLTRRMARGISVILIILLIIIIIFNTEKAYTVYVFSITALALLISLWDKTGIPGFYYITFLAILIPFTLVNSILTGSFIESEVVWYNDVENLGIRFLTIPLEDFFYGFSLILFSLLLRNKIRLLFGRQRS